MIYVYTSIIDGWDNVRPPACGASDFARYICFTNVPNLPRVSPWEYRPAYDMGSPSKTSRVAKIMPHLMLPADAEASIYHDGNFQLRRDPAEMVAQLLDGRDWASHRHPARNCVYREADILLRENIGDGEKVRAEIQRYRDALYPENNGLWANGLLVRRHSRSVEELNETWWRLYIAGCGRDQLSFPVARHKTGVELNTIENCDNNSIYSSHWILFRWHAAWRHREDNSDYWSQRDGIRAKLARLRELTETNGHINHIAE